MSGGGEQPTSQDAAGGGGGGGGTFKFAPFCKASGSATQNPQDPVAKQFMAYHNVHRTFHGACSLLWDPALAKQAQAAANTCKFQHQMTGDNGQNVAEQSASGNIPAGTVSMWYEEGSKTNYQGGNMQQGHYTQVLWKDTFALGCGVKNCGQMTLVFCDYAPAGNMMGAFEQNVGNIVPNARPVCAEQQAMSQYAGSGGGQGGGSGAGGKCITDQELGLPASAGGSGGGGGGGQMKKGKGVLRGNQQGGGGGGGMSPFAQMFQGGGGGGGEMGGG
ncbi:CAP domain-containing protein [Phyllosticta citrichinensis]|uniref:CAP domain-containing protein n=1 Tax=Phyllosticta citrichinensis TaxID=1130410 RepID=A0ABR1XXD3_9PEZI